MLKVKILLSCLILSLLLSTTTVFAHQESTLQQTAPTESLVNKENLNKVSQIPVSVVEDVVKSHMNNILNEIDSEFSSIWSDVSVYYSADVYDITDNVIGYYFKIVNTDGENVGYYITGARTDITPILEYSASPHYNFETRNRDLNIYYFNGVSYTFSDSADTLIKELKEYYIENDETNSLNSSNITYTNEFTELLSSLTFNRNSVAPVLWAEALQPNHLNSLQPSVTSSEPLESHNLSSLASLPTSYSLSITRMWQRQSGVNHPKSACGPTSLAMALNYLSNTVGLNVLDLSDFNNSESEMINGLYNYLGTGIIGTSSGNMSYFLHEILNDNMSGWAVTKVNGNDTGAIDKYKDRVVSSRPPLLMWDTIKLPWETYDVTWHWQTGSAYRNSNGSFEFGVKDPDGGANNTATKYYSWEDNKKGFHFLSYKQN